MSRARLARDTIGPMVLRTSGHVPDARRTTRKHSNELVSQSALKGGSPP